MILLSYLLTEKKHCYIAFDIPTYPHLDLET